MTPEQLKASILQYAIQGKLVEQRPEEGNAEELYKHIQKEKQTLIKEGNIKKEKSLAEITEDEIPFDIPESWKWVKHNDLFEIVGGSQPPKSNFKEYPEEGDVRLYQIRDYGETPVPIYVDKKLVSKFTKKGDILLARYGGSLGKVFWAKEGAYNVALAKIVMLYKTELIDKNFLYYYYLAPLYQNFVKGSNRAAQGGFNKDDLNNLLFPLPPLAEQYRIVAKIEELLPLVDRYAASYEKLEQFNAKFPEDMKKSILQYAIQGKLVEQRPEEGTAEELYQQIQGEKQKLIKEGKIKKEKPLAEITEDEIPFDIPESWRWVRFAEFGSYKKGPFGSTLTKSMFVPKGKDTIKVYEQKNAIQKDATLGEYYITKEYYEKSMTGFEVHSGDVIVSCAGTIGETFIMPDKIEKGIINQALMRMQLMPSVYKPYFLLFFDVVLKKNAIKSSKGSAIKNIPPFDELKAYLVPLPPLAEQHRIVAKIEELLPYCDRMVK